jgi:hypothetical protein
MRCIQSFLPSNLAGYKSNNSCSASTQYDAQRAACGVIPNQELSIEKPLSKLERPKTLQQVVDLTAQRSFLFSNGSPDARSG